MDTKELLIYLEMLKIQPKYKLGETVFCKPSDEEGRGFMPCTVIGVTLMHDIHGRGYHYTLIFHHDSYQQTDYQEGCVCNQIDLEVQESWIKPNL